MWKKREREREVDFLDSRESSPSSVGNWQRSSGRGTQMELVHISLITVPPHEHVNYEQATRGI